MKNLAIILLSCVFLVCGAYAHASGNSAAKSVRNVQKLFATIIGKKISLNPDGYVLDTDQDLIFNSEEDEEEAEETKRFLSSRDSLTPLFSLFLDDSFQPSKTVSPVRGLFYFNHAPLYIAQRVLLI